MVRPIWGQHRPWDLSVPTDCESGNVRHSMTDSMHVFVFICGDEFVDIYCCLVLQALKDLVEEDSRPCAQNTKCNMRCPQISKYWIILGFLCAYAFSLKQPMSPWFAYLFCVFNPGGKSPRLIRLTEDLSHEILQTYKAKTQNRIVRLNNVLFKTASDKCI